MTGFKSRILIVDDEVLGRETLEALLFSEGYTLDFAASGSEALQKAVETQPDLLLLDVMMPEMTGYEVCQRLRQNPATAEMPVIMVTALDDQDARLRGLQAGADDFVSKPINRMELRARVRTITRLNRYRSLMEERSRFEQMVRLSPDGILMLDEHRKVILANAAILEQLYLSSESEVLGKPVADLFTVDEQARFHQHLDRLITPGFPTLKWSSLLHPTQGDPLHVEVTAGCLDWRGISVVQLLVRDISERVAAERTIQSQVEMLSAMFTGAQMLAHNLDPVLLAADIVHACVEALGVDAVWLGRVEPDARIVPWNYAPAEWDLLGEISLYIDHGEENRERDGYLVHSSGSIVTNQLDTGLSSRAFKPLAALGLACAVSFPLADRGQMLGVLLLFSRHPGYFTSDRLELFQAFANQVGAALQNAALFKQTQQRLDYIRSLHAIDKAIMASPDLDQTLQVLLEQVIRQLDMDAANVLLYNNSQESLTFAAGAGFRGKSLPFELSKSEQILAGLVAQNARPLYINTAEQLAEAYRSVQGFENEKFVAYLGVPLVAKNNLQGVLEMYRRTPLKPLKEWFEMVDTLAGQAAIAIENAALFNHIQVANRELEEAYDATLEGWARALDLRDNETEGHTQRVTDLAVKLARLVGIDEENLVHIWRGALLHDMGKLGVPDNVLLKPGPLTPEEWKIMRQHPVYAYRMLSPIKFLRPALVIPYMHHEHWDGSGYPQGLSGEQIPLSARLFTLVDVWDALRSDRPYRRAWTDQQTADYIRKHTGKIFDPNLAPIFLKFVGY